jgi:glucokinase
MSGLIVGVDIGGTKTAILVTEASEEAGGTIRARTVAPTAVGAPERAADAIASLVAAALAEAAATPADVAALGVGVPGRVDRERGHVTLAVNLDWHDLPLGPRLQDRLGIPTVVENDVRAAALGLHRRGLFGRRESLALLAIGTGISAGIVLDGTLHRGATGLAGEIGHAVLDPNGPRCACGNTGCFEAVAAGPAIVARTRAGWAARRNGTEAHDAATTAEAALARDGAAAVYAAAAAGDEVAAEVVDSTGRAIAWGIHLLALAYDVERIVIGGGVSHAGEPFMAPIRRQLDRYRAASALAAEILPPDRVQLLPAGADAGAWGAVTIARATLGLGSGSPGLASEPPALAPQGREVGHA